MALTSLRPLAAVGLVAVLIGYVGCSKPRDQATTSAAKKNEPPKSAAAPSSKLFADWPTPAGALVIAGEQLGYLEPCGCTEGQLGGLLRRYDLLERLRENQKWPLVIVDLGSLIKDPAAARGGPEQARIKYKIALEALATSKANALALSPEDLKVGVDEAVGQWLNLQGESLKIVAANVSAAGLEGRVVPSVRAKAGPVSVGITAVVDPQALVALQDRALDLLSVKPIDDTLPAVLADLEKDTQTQVLLVQAAPELAKALAAKYPGFDVVVGRSPLDSAPEDAERLNNGKTLLVTVGQKGKYAGVVGLYEDPQQKYRYQRVTLNNRFDGPALAMKRVIERDYREALKGQAVVENFPRHDYVNGATGATFVGAEGCRTCHPNTYARWAATKHAFAYDALLKDPKPNVVFDAECVTCHTTGFEYTSGWRSAESTPLLKGNQCENCHGPGSKHVAEPENREFVGLMQLTAERAEKTRLCIRCHDEDNSPHFDFAKYWGQIVHKGLDNPKDHMKTPAKVARQNGP